MEDNQNLNENNNELEQEIYETPRRSCFRRAFTTVFLIIAIVLLLTNSSTLTGLKFIIQAFNNKYVDKMAFSLAETTEITTLAEVTVETTACTTTEITIEATTEGTTKGELLALNIVPEETYPDKEIKYLWDYKFSSWSLPVTINGDSYRYYKSKSRNMIGYDFARYITDENDDAFFEDFGQKINDAGKSEGYTDYETIELAIAFVQSLKYTSDSITQGVDEYPKYPYETLYDEGGDCEDTSILLAQMITAMGYEAVLIKFPGHVGVGIRVDGNAYGASYSYEGKNFSYVETTGTGFQFGELPDEFKGAEAQIVPIY